MLAKNVILAEQVNEQNKLTLCETVRVVSVCRGFVEQNDVLDTKLT